MVSYSKVFLSLLALVGLVTFAPKPAAAATYDYLWLQQSYNVPQYPDVTKEFTLTAKNTGTATWRNDGTGASVKLGTYRPRDRTSPLYHSSWLSPTRVDYFAGKAQLDGNGRPVRDGDGNVVYDSGATTIAPGEAAHYVFTVNPPPTPYAGNEYFNLLVENVTWLPDAGIFWPINVGQGFAAQWVGQSAYPTIDKGTSPIGSIYFDYKNTGSFPWIKDGIVRLGTSHNRDRSSQFVTEGLSGGSSPALPTNTANWLSNSRTGSFAGKVSGGSLDTGATVINPGETGRFFAPIDTRSTWSGNYREYFQLVAEQYAWMFDYGAFMDIALSSSAPRVAAAGDIACDPTHGSYNGGNGTATECRMKAVSDWLLVGDYDKILTLGDLQYEHGELSKFNQSYEQSWGRLKADTAPAPGNHEYHTANASGYFSYFGSAAGDPSKGYYSYDIGDWHVIALNSSWDCNPIGCGAGSAQETWLRADLAANTNKCTLAYWHHPRFSSSGRGNNANYDAFWQALDDYDADIVLNGHEHHYERFNRQTPEAVASTDGIREFVVGTGGRNLSSFGTIRANSAFRGNQVFGALELTLNSHSYDWYFRPVSGQLMLDYGSTPCR